MPAKINITSSIFLYTRGHGRIKFFQNPDGRETTQATGHTDDNKHTYEANILCTCSVTFKVFRKHTFFHIKHLQPPSSIRQRRTVLDRFVRPVLLFGSLQII